MDKFKQLEEFERNFEKMGIEELRRWQSYWTQHAQFLAPKVRKEAMRRVHEIEKTITRLELES